MTLPEPDYLELPERLLVGVTREFSLDTRSEIPAFWEAFWARNWELAGEQEPACYGISHCVKPDGRFNYAIGLHFTPFPDERPEDSCVITLSAGRYAVFRKRGPVYEIPAMFDEIFGNWLPASGETQRDGAVYERYLFSDDCTMESMSYEIWVPVE